MSYITNICIRGLGERSHSYANSHMKFANRIRKEQSINNKMSKSKSQGPTFTSQNKKCLDSEQPEIGENFFLIS